jgi:hypothetical protein
VWDDIGLGGRMDGTDIYEALLGGREVSRRKLESVSQL